MTLKIGIDLSIVIIGCHDGKPCILVTKGHDGQAVLPFGTFDPDKHRTFEIALRGWVREQTGFQLGHVEQLYTFGDRGRDSPAGRRIVSVGYLALTPPTDSVPETFQAHWHDWYQYFPWEDHRQSPPYSLENTIVPGLHKWAGTNIDRRTRVQTALGLDAEIWPGEAVLERYELLYESGLVAEHARDNGLIAPSCQLPGAIMASDHRRILATAMSRLRAKIRYRPIIFDLMPGLFTLTDLQVTAEIILGQNLHKQNFRRALNRAGLVTGTGRMTSRTGGRPAELYRFKPASSHRSGYTGLSTPVKKIDNARP